MKTALRIVGLALAALMGLWLLGHGIAIGVGAHQRIAEGQDILASLVESSVFIAGGICVLSVSVQQLCCWCTHRKDGGLL
jgi:hypothetical protein